MSIPLLTRTLMHEAVARDVLVWILPLGYVPALKDPRHPFALPYAASYRLSPHWGRWHTAVIITHEALTDPQMPAGWLEQLLQPAEPSLAVLRHMDDSRTIEAVPALNTAQVAWVYRAWHQELRDVARLTSYQVLPTKSHA